MKISVLGNFSGRNAGDNAILGNLVRDVASVLPDAEFLVPTLNPGFVSRMCQGYKVRPMGLMPWHGALKIFGLSTLRAMTATDCILVTDNILFDKSFFNPAFNYLSTISLFAPLAQSRDIPIILYNASVGPVTTQRGAAALRRVLRNSPFAILRDRSSQELIRRIVVPTPTMIAAADCALNTEVPPRERLDGIAKSLGIEAGHGPFIGLNINIYVDAWQSGGGTTAKDGFVRRIAATFDEIVQRTGAKPVFFVTQVMDRGITESVRSSMKHGSGAPVVVVGAECNYREIAGLLGRMELLVAMRTHALILATSVCTPSVNLNAYPKSAAYMETIGQQQWNLDIGSFDGRNLVELALRAWAERVATRAGLEACIPGEKDKATRSAQLVADLLRSRDDGVAR